MFINVRNSLVQTVSLYFLVWIAFGPIDTEYLNYRNLFIQSSMFSATGLWLLKIFLGLISVMLLFNPEKMYALLAQLILGSIFLSLGIVSNSLWNYNTHVLMILLLVFIAGAPRYGAKSESDLKTGIAILFSLIYFQAGFSKLIGAGIDWMTSGLSIFVHMNDFNPMLADWLRGNKTLYIMAAWATVIGEIVLGVLFIIPKSRASAAILSLMFHGLVWCVFNISFWHLWIFYPALFSVEIRSWLREHLSSTQLIKNNVIKKTVPTLQIVSQTERIS